MTADPVLLSGVVRAGVHGDGKLGFGFMFTPHSPRGLGMPQDPEPAAYPGCGAMAAAVPGGFQELGVGGGASRAARGLALTVLPGLLCW